MREKYRFVINKVRVLTKRKLFIKLHNKKYIESDHDKINGVLKQKDRMKRT